MDWDGFRLVIDPRTGRYPDGLEREREFEFRRPGEDTTARYRLADQGPYFNVANLFFREATTAAR